MDRRLVGLAAGTAAVAVVVALSRRANRAPRPPAVVPAEAPAVRTPLSPRAAKKKMRRGRKKRTAPEGAPEQIPASSEEVSEAEAVASAPNEAADVHVPGDWSPRAAALASRMLEGSEVSEWRLVDARGRPIAAARDEPEPSAPTASSTPSGEPPDDAAPAEDVSSTLPIDCFPEPARPACERHGQEEGSTLVCNPSSPDRASTPPPKESETQSGSASPEEMSPDTSHDGEEKPKFEKDRWWQMCVEDEEHLGEVFAADIVANQRTRRAR